MTFFEDGDKRTLRRALPFVADDIGFSPVWRLHPMIRIEVAFCHMPVTLSQSTASNLRPVESALFEQRLPHFNHPWIIHGQDGDRDPADGRSPNQMGSIPAKMPRPFVPPWVEQSREPLGDRVDSRDIRPLVTVVVQTRKGQVIERRSAAVLAVR